jgi:hypothetical protein
MSRKCITPGIALEDTVLTQDTLQLFMDMYGPTSSSVAELQSVAEELVHVTSRDGGFSHTFAQAHAMAQDMAVLEKHARGNSASKSTLDVVRKKGGAVVGSARAKKSARQRVDSTDEDNASKASDSCAEAEKKAYVRVLRPRLRQAVTALKTSDSEAGERNEECGRARILTASRSSTRRVAAQPCTATSAASTATYLAASAASNDDNGSHVAATSADDDDDAGYTTVLVYPYCKQTYGRFGASRVETRRGTRGNMVGVLLFAGGAGAHAMAQAAVMQATEYQLLAKLVVGKCDKASVQRWLLLAEQRERCDDASSCYGDGWIAQTDEACQASSVARRHDVDLSCDEVLVPMAQPETIGATDTTVAEKPEDIRTPAHAACVLSPGSRRALFAAAAEKRRQQVASGPDHAAPECIVP